MAEFNLEVKQFGNYAVLHSKGYINNLAGERIADECGKLMDNGYRKLILNLEQSTVVNSIGVSILIEIIEKILSVRGRLAFSNLSPTVAKTFKIMGLLQYAEMFGDENQAISAFSEANV